MLDDSQLKNLLSKKEFTKTDKILLCLASEADRPKPTAEIKSIGVRCGLRSIRSWNIGAYLNSASDRAIKTVNGWELTADGENAVRTLAGQSPVMSISPALRRVAAAITDDDTNKFVLEAIGCFEAHHYRAAVVLSWVGAISVLYEHVLNDQRLLSAVNAEASSRNSKWKAAKTKDDLACMKERTFLEILVKLSVIGKSIKTELFGCLDYRNACGHPNSMIIGEHRVSGHVEFLIQNVYAKF